MSGNKPIYPDMKLWQEIIFLKHHCKKDWVIENVIPYYKPFIQPSFTIGKHHYWSKMMTIFVPAIFCKKSKDYKTEREIELEKKLEIAVKALITYKNLRYDGTVTGYDYIAKEALAKIKENN